MSRDGWESGEGRSTGLSRQPSQRKQWPLGAEVNIILHKSSISFSGAFLASVLVTGVISGPARSEAISAENVPDCGIWIQARSARQSIGLENYLIGLLNGMALGSGIEFWRANGVKVTSQQVFLWMDGFCRREPLETIILGSVTLINERTNGSWARKR